MSTALDFQARAAELSQSIGADDDWLAEIRDRSRRLFAGLKLPTRKTEAWRYTPVANALTPELAQAARAMPVAVDRIARAITLPECNSLRLVFINGHYSPALSDGAPLEGIRISRFADADAETQALIKSRLGQSIDAERHPFSTLNASLLTDGLLIQVEAGAQIDRPVHVVWYSAAQEQPYCTAGRLLWLQGENSEASLIEHFCGDPDAGLRFDSTISEIDLGANAGLTHYRLQLDGGSARHVGGLHVSQARDSRFSSNQLAMGSELKRLDMEIGLRAAGAESQVRGIYLTRGKQHVDNHSNVQHIAGHCHSEAVFKGIIDDQSRAVFDGRIHIHEQAQKTEAHLTNRNLLLSNRAEVNTKPELEIYADDVKCSHGATVGQLDKEALFYLRARGIDAVKARAILSVGFVNELLNAMPNQAIRHLLEPQLADFFGDRETVDRLLQL